MRSASGSIAVLTNKTVLVTGGTGFIGSHLVDALLARGASVVALTRRRPHADREDGAGRLRWIEGDVAGPSRGWRPTERPVETVFHLAALTDLAACRDDRAAAFAVNAEGVRRMVEVARALGARRFVYVSTLGVYGEPRYLPIDEQHPTAPIEAYAQSKLAGEAMTLAAGGHGIDVVIARSFNAYGPRQQRTMVVPSIVCQLIAGRDIQLENVEATRDFVYVEDVVQGLLRVASEGRDGEIYNLGSGAETSIRDVVNEVAAQLGRTMTLTTRPAAVDRVMRSCADIRKARRELGWAPETSLDRGLKQTVDYHRAVSAAGCGAA